MKNRRLLVALTVLNLGLLAYQVIKPRLAYAQGNPQVLRGRALEIVDERGKVRAQLGIFPANRGTSCRTAIRTPRRSSSA